ncbi:MAG: sigma-70 family RNA polymerase sigma factor [Planctomycetales bacterium]|nr:sigma-70 family RNA polymerase sigma factor [Planctomycetales bacterium]
MHASDETDVLLGRLAAGDAAAANALLHRYRDRLRRMVALRIDDRVTSRFDPSDVVQEALLVASRRIRDYALRRELPFYPWLRHIAWEQLLKFHERHIYTKKRAVEYERPLPQLSDESLNLLVKRLAGANASPSERLLMQERQVLVRAALAKLQAVYREVLELRYLEQLDNAEIAAVLNVNETTVRTRHFRAIERLHRLLREGSPG